MKRSLLLLPPLLALCLAPPGMALVLGCAEGAPPQTPASVTSPPAAAPAPAADAEIRAALAAGARTERERARDGARHPLETLSFFGVRSDSSVVELWPGGGYYTAILAPLLAERGKLTVTHFDPAGDPKSEETQDTRAFLERLAKAPATFGKVERSPIALADLRFGPDESADFVLTFRNVHNWIEDGYADAVFAAAARVLKHGGVLGIEEHRGKPGLSIKEIRDTGYTPEDTVVALATKAGLRLVARSEVNANPKDTKDYRAGVWSLPPTLAEKDVNREKYLAIGESDRMTLKFVKP